MKKDFESVRQMAVVMSKEWLPLLEKTLPKILVHIFPHFATGKNNLSGYTLKVLMIYNADSLWTLEL